MFDVATCRIAADVELGDDVKIVAFVNLYGCKIGARTKIGTFVEVQRNAVVGSDCKIQSHTFICEGISIGDRVFVGHGVTFINDRNPIAAFGENRMLHDADWNLEPTRVESDARIGSGCTILCGITIGQGALIGAGSVVTKSVPAGEVWCGNPAHFLRYVDQQKTTKESRGL